MVGAGGGHKSRPSFPGRRWAGVLSGPQFSPVAPLTPASPPSPARCQLAGWRKRRAAPRQLTLCPAAPEREVLPGGFPTAGEMCRPTALPRPPGPLIPWYTGRQWGSRAGTPHGTPHGTPGPEWLSSAPPGSTPADHVLPFTGQTPSDVIGNWPAGLVGFGKLQDAENDHWRMRLMGNPSKFIDGSWRQ